MLDPYNESIQTPVASASAHGLSYRAALSTSQITEVSAPPGASHSFCGHFRPGQVLFS